MYEDLFDKLLEAKKLKIKANVVISTLRRGLQKELDSYKLSNDVADLPYPEYNISIKQHSDKVTYSIELVEGELAPTLFTQKFSFEIVEETDDGSQVSEHMGTVEGS